ncbi:hypothetical protein BDP81DRAFT_11007 [Colletotrichum phormii]|uniref:Secreted protein n=1 Tax=Colletotrichum phormii TaxID=359342 RepID=A0AAJ0A7A2_9PEZI|nr:uncharacterized protein BDP81DRAFT_11007 [Colletotrichum phormii]KAK1655855.1 hypothetical protein BDP81DRAFT_11007 [Colletotrichum phormii]
MRCNSTCLRCLLTAILWRRCCRSISLTCRLRHCLHGQAANAWEKATSATSPRLPCLCEVTNDTRGMAVLTATQTTEKRQRRCSPPFFSRSDKEHPIPIASPNSPAERHGLSGPVVDGVHYILLTGLTCRPVGCSTRSFGEQRDHFALNTTCSGGACSRLLWSPSDNVDTWAGAVPCPGSDNPKPPNSAVGFTPDLCRAHPSRGHLLFISGCSALLTHE